MIIGMWCKWLKGMRALIERLAYEVDDGHEANVFANRRLDDILG